MTRVMIVVFTVMTGGATYAGYYGVGGEDQQISQSIRNGSAGRGIGFIGGVK